MRITTIRPDSISQTLRVVCPEHGELASYRPRGRRDAERDAQAHDDAHHRGADPGKSETGPGSLTRPDRAGYH